MGNIGRGESLKEENKMGCFYIYLVEIFKWSWLVGYWLYVFEVYRRGRVGVIILGVIIYRWYWRFLDWMRLIREWV